MRDPESQVLFEVSRNSSSSLIVETEDNRTRAIDESKTIVIRVLHRF